MSGSKHRLQVKRWNNHGYKYYRILLPIKVSDYLRLEHDDVLNVTVHSVERKKK